MRQTTLILLAGLAHGVSDTAVGLLLGQVLVLDSIRETASLVVFYNLLAFGFQPLIGWLMDRWPAPRKGCQTATLLGLLCSAAALVCFPFSAGSAGSVLPALLLLGCGSAAFHAGGGGLTGLLAEGRFSRLGFFTAPGAVGLAVGLALAFAGKTSVVAPLAGLLVILAVVIAVFPLPEETEPHIESVTASDYPVARESEVEWVALLLLFAIALRSAIWSAMQSGAQSDGQAGLLLLGLAATVGKLAGGWLTDWLGWRKWVWLSLPLAALLLAFSQQQRWLLLAGLALLQSVTPVALGLLQRLFPARPAAASGLGLGLGIWLGAIPVYLNLTSWLLTPILVLLLVTGAGALLLYSKNSSRRRRR